LQGCSIYRIFVVPPFSMPGVWREKNAELFQLC
jgi:hypothetical protein